jgi:hypothetical protein
MFLGRKPRGPRSRRSRPAPAVARAVRGCEQIHIGRVAAERPRYQVVGRVSPMRAARVADPAVAFDHQPAVRAQPGPNRSAVVPGSAGRQAGQWSPLVGVPHPRHGLLNAISRLSSLVSIQCHETLFGSRRSGSAAVSPQSSSQPTATSGDEVHSWFLLQSLRDRRARSQPERTRQEGPPSSSTSYGTTSYLVGFYKQWRDGEGGA